MAPSWYCCNDSSSMEGVICRGCGMESSLWTDWSAGDVVCRECGVVLESHVRYDGPEWREFAADKADGLGPSGGVPRASAEDGPTVWRGSNNQKSIQLLMKMQRKTQRTIDKLHQQEALEHQLYVTASTAATTGTTNNSSIQTDLSTIDSHHDPIANVTTSSSTASKTRTSITSASDSKWSVARALSIYDNENPTKEEEKEWQDLYSKAELKCAHQLYQAMKTLEKYILQLSLNNHRTLYDQMVHILLQYLHQHNYPSNNSQKLLPALLGSIIYKSTQPQRTLLQICTTINSNSQTDTAQHIRPKHCSIFLRRLHPFYHSPNNNVDANSAVAAKKEEEESKSSTSNVNHNHDDNQKNRNILESLSMNFSQMQIQVIATCGTQLQIWQRQFGIGSGISTMNILASTIYFIGHVASIYQSLLFQNTQNNNNNNLSTAASSLSNVATTPSMTSSSSIKEEIKEKNKVSTKKRKRNKSFDLMLDEAIPMETPSCNNNSFLEMNNDLLNWWKKESSWFQSLSDIEKSCHISQRKILSYIKTSILPHKEELLNAIQQEHQNKSIFQSSSFVSSMSPLLTWNRLTLKS